MTSPTTQETLLLIFQLSSGGSPSRAALSAHLGCPLQTVDSQLGRLRSYGWVHPERVRLTMAGLVIASAAQAAQNRLTLERVADAENVPPSPFHRHRYPTPARRCTDGYPAETASPPRITGLGASLVSRTEAIHTRNDAEAVMPSPFQSVA